MAIKKGLGSKGRGLEALINNNLNNIEKVRDKDIFQVDINKVEPNRSQPRKNFEENSLIELANSIKKYGVIQPIILKKNGDSFEIIAGERRWRAAKIAGLNYIPAILRDYKDDDAFQIALIENLQRENLNPIEEALSYKKLMDEFNLSNEEIAENLGKSRSVVSNSIRLLKLDSRVQMLLLENKISSGHCRPLISIDDGDLQFEIAEKIIEDELTVRSVEYMVKKILGKNQQFSKKEVENVDEDDVISEMKKFDSRNYSFIEKELQSILGRKVKLNLSKNKGKLEIEYYSDDDLDELFMLIKKLKV